MSDVLAVVDFPGIKNFVFGTSPLREIRGGSAILEELNVEFLPKKLRQRLGENYEEVFMGGGAGMFLAKDTSTEVVDKHLVEIGGEVFKKTSGGVRLVWGLSDFGDGVFKEAVERAHLNLGFAKSGFAGFDANEDCGGRSLFLECKSCSKPGANMRWEEKGVGVGEGEGAGELGREGSGGGEETEWLCRTCWLKRDNRKKGTSWRELVNYLGLKGFYEEHRPEDFTELAKMRLGGENGGSREYLAVLYMDGDSMGRLVKSIPDKDSFRLFSETVDGCLRRSVYNAVKKQVGKIAKESSDGGLKSVKELPLDILLLGGDDLVMVTKVNHAFEMAFNIAEAFNKTTKEEFQKHKFFDDKARKQGLSVSCGIAVFKPRQPFKTVLDQAESLLKLAKKRRSESGAEEAFIDFADVTQSRYTDIEQARAIECGVGTDRELTCWPMSLTEAEKFWGSLKDLKAGGKVGVPNGRLKKIAEIVRKNRRVGFETMRVIAHSKSEQVKKFSAFFQENGMWPEIPWKQEDGKKKTAMLDAAAVYPFVPDARE